jgi:hypothetical protein
VRRRYPPRPPVFDCFAVLGFVLWVLIALMLALALALLVDLLHVGSSW